MLLHLLQNSLSSKWSNYLCRKIEKQNNISFKRFQKWSNLFWVAFHINFLFIFNSEFSERVGSTVGGLEEVCNPKPGQNSRIIFWLFICSLYWHRAKGLWRLKSGKKKMCETLEKFLWTVSLKGVIILPRRKKSFVKFSKPAPHDSKSTMEQILYVR